MPPCASILNGCIGWSPVRGSPETITSGDALGGTGAAGSAAFRAGARAEDRVCASIAGSVLQREEESAGRRRIVAVIGAAPGVDVDHPIGRHHHLPSVAN